MTAPLGRVVHGHPFDYAQAEHVQRSRDWHNCCAMFTRLAFGCPSVGDYDGDGAADAEDQWKAAQHKHPETDPLKIPRGVPVYWAGGSSDNGHAAISRGGGTIWTTDLIRDGHVDVAHIADVHAKWGLTLLGWTEDIGGVRVWQPTAAKPPTPAPKPKSAGRDVDAALPGFRRARDRSKSPERKAWLTRLIDSIRRHQKAPK